MHAKVQKSISSTMDVGPDYRNCQMGATGLDMARSAAQARRVTLALAMYSASMPISKNVSIASDSVQTIG